MTWVWTSLLRSFVCDEWLSNSDIWRPGFHHSVGRLNVITARCRVRVRLELVFGPKGDVGLHICGEGREVLVVLAGSWSILLRALVPVGVVSHGHSRSSTLGE